MDKKKKIRIWLPGWAMVLWLLVSLFSAGCANRGMGPQGGPVDSIPPVPLKAEPENGSVNFTGNRIEVTFDEYIQLNNVAQNMLMSPPQQTPPEVKARGKKLLIHFVDSLRDSTTYTIDFGSAVCDYNERVPLHGYAFAFATGPTIDTLETFGLVVDAENLDPVYGVYAGIYSNLSDTAFVSEPFLRVARTDSAGMFRIGNMRAGRYRLYAVDDISRDYRLTVGEALAFDPEPFTVDGAMSHNTMSNDTASNDTVAEVPLHVLYLFREKQQRLYLQRTLREQQHCVRVLFSSAPDSLPIFRALDDSVSFFPSYSQHADTVSLWLIDSLSILRDSLFFEIRYRRTDSLYHLEWATDTLRAIWRAPRKAAKTPSHVLKPKALELKCNARQGFELNDTLLVLCSTPMALIEADSLHLLQVVDSLRKPLEFAIQKSDSTPMSFQVVAPMQPGQIYELRLDSGALTDIYGVSNVYSSYTLQLRTPEDYSTLRVRLNPAVANARIQVLNNKDQVVRELPATDDGAYFQYLKADTYFLRMYIDLNGDGEWTTGSWTEARQPEPIYYYPNSIQTKSNWDFEEEWDYRAVPQLDAKPKQLIHAAPKKK